MKIQCTLIRNGGTKVELDDAEYHFKDDGSGRHIADVTNREHIKRLLAIPEAYQLTDEEIGESEHVKGVKEDAPARDDNDAENDDHEEDDKDDEQSSYEAERAELVAAHKERFGVKPHGKLSNDAIRAKLDAKE